MIIKRLELQNFRNYEHQAIDFSPNLNVLIGKNAQGKTNLVEAINFCCIGKSHRTSKDKELISFDRENARIKVFAQRSAGEKTVEIVIPRQSKKIVRINNMSILRIGELFGNINSVFFSPEDLKLVKESPIDRRRFIDIDISQLSKVYFYNLLRYEKILAQRNKLLKNSFDNTQAMRGLDVWNEQLAQVGAKIILTRIHFIEHLSKLSKKQHYLITDNQEELTLTYTGIQGSSVDEIYRQLFTNLEKSTEKDLQLGYTTVGPHRDDIKIVCNDIDIRSFGSQGQQRTVALSLKLAELEIFKEECGEYPILLLDDVLSELDNKRCEKLLDSISKVQTILTGTSFDFDRPVTRFLIDNGHILKQN